MVPPLTLFTIQRIIRTEIEEIDSKIAHLNDLRRHLEEDLLKLHEEDLELQDERASSPCYPDLTSFVIVFPLVEGVHEHLTFEAKRGIEGNERPVTSGFRRLRGVICSCSSKNPLMKTLAVPAFVPSEHDDLPPGVAFMV